MNIKTFEYFSIIEILRFKLIEVVFKITKRWCWADMVTWATGCHNGWKKSNKCGYCRACFGKEENNEYFNKKNENEPF